MKTFPYSHDREQGSLLIVALVLCAVIGVCIASFVQIGRTTMMISNRALYNNAAMNLAENGLEEAMYSINKKVNDATYTWTGWSTGSGNAWHTFPTSGPDPFDQNATGPYRD